MTRPLTDDERRRIARARANIAAAEADLAQRRRELDELALAIFQSRGSVTELARELGVSRTTFYDTIRRLG